MNIKIYQENRLTRQPFFKTLITYLSENNEVQLRTLHQEFSKESHLDRKIETYIDAGLILRKNKRYSNAFHVFSDADFEPKQIEIHTNAPQHLSYDHPFFVAKGSQIERLLDASQIYQTLSNDVNAIKLHETTQFGFKTPENNNPVKATLANYFIKLEEGVPLSAFENEIYARIGDVDPNYALKYMTTFLLKFSNHSHIKARTDIFIETLEKYHYIEQISEKEYCCKLKFSTLCLETKHFDEAKDFIAAQIGQTQNLPDFIEI